MLAAIGVVERHSIRDLAETSCSTSPPAPNPAPSTPGAESVEAHIHGLIETTSVRLASIALDLNQGPFGPTHPSGGGVGWAAR
jgi:hypothetical protein